MKEETFNDQYQGGKRYVAGRLKCLKSQEGWWWDTGSRLSKSKRKEWTDHISSIDLNTLVRISTEKAHKERKMSQQRFKMAYGD